MKTIVTEPVAGRPVSALVPGPVGVLLVIEHGAVFAVHEMTYGAPTQTFRLLGRKYPNGWGVIQPTTEHLVFFLATPVKTAGLQSSTVIVLDERGPSVISITDAGDEG